MGGWFRHYGNETDNLILDKLPAFLQQNSSESEKFWRLKSALDDLTVIETRRFRVDERPAPSKRVGNQNRNGCFPYITQLWMKRSAAPFPRRRESSRQLSGSPPPANDVGEFQTNHGLSCSTAKNHESMTSLVSKNRNAETSQTSCANGNDVSRVSRHNSLR